MGIVATEIATGWRNRKEKEKIEMKMENGAWKMGIKLMRNSSIESPPIFISKWKNIGKTFYFILF